MHRGTVPSAEEINGLKLEAKISTATKDQDQSSVVPPQELYSYEPLVQNEATLDWSRKMDTTVNNVATIQNAINVISVKNLFVQRHQLHNQSPSLKIMDPLREREIKRRQLHQQKID